MFCFKYFVYIFQTLAGKYYSVKYVPEKYHFFETETDRLVCYCCYDQHQQLYTFLYVLSFQVKYGLSPLLGLLPCVL